MITPHRNHYMKYARVSLGCLLCILLAPSASASELKSPDGNLVVDVELKDLGPEHGCPVYRVAYKGRDVLKDSRLGLDLEQGPLVADLQIAGEARRQVNEAWKPVCGERDVIPNHYNQLAIDLREAQSPHRMLRVTFRAYDEGIAFCYTLPEQANLKGFAIKAERTQFHFGGDFTTWAVYTAQADYTHSAVPLSQVKPGAERPLTIRFAKDLYASITEARCVDSARMKLKPATDAPDTLEAFLDAERGKAGEVTGVAPFTSPWRVILVADSPGKLLEHDYLIPTLNDPCALSDTSWIKPGKAIREVTLTTAGGKACVDFCVGRGMQFVELDAGWYGPERDPKSDATAVGPKKAARLDLQEVIHYANMHGIGVILYVNQKALERQRDVLFPLYEKWGVRGVKFGFVNVGSQKWTAWLHQGIRMAAAHHLMVDIHDEFRNTGYQRTYPNLMTVEGIGGDETFPTPIQNATLPFTRFLTGPADHTYCWYSPKLKVTHAHQLAITTINFSPWQFLYWYDKPAQYNGDPALEYWKDLPTCWDETRVLAGDIGKYVSVARRHGDEWYVGTIRPEGRGEFDVPLSFLRPGVKYVATIYSDQQVNNPDSKAVKVKARAVDHTTVLKACMPANGGQAVRIVPAGS
jgi:alpha-glucosidase